MAVLGYVILCSQVVLLASQKCIAVYKWSRIWPPGRCFNH